MVQVDGAAGERLIWRRRGEPETNPHAPPVKPTKLHFVLDCSGSMYRFNGQASDEVSGSDSVVLHVCVMECVQDGRLNRVIEAAVLIMEGFHGLEHKYVTVAAPIKP